MKGLATHLQCARSSFAIAQQLAQVRGLLRLQVRFARIKELLQEPEAQRVLRLSLCQSLGQNCGQNRVPTSAKLPCGTC